MQILSPLPALYTKRTQTQTQTIYNIHTHTNINTHIRTHNFIYILIHTTRTPYTHYFNKHFPSILKLQSYTYFLVFQLPLIYVWVYILRIFSPLFLVFNYRLHNWSNPTPPGPSMFPRLNPRPSREATSAHMSNPGY